MNRLMEKILSPDNLNQAWLRVRGDHAPWSETMDRRAMDRKLVTLMMSLVEDVRCGRYRPQRLRQFVIDKADGRKRVISAWYLQDKLLQRATLQVLEPIAESQFHTDSFGYRPKRSVDMACERARARIEQGMLWVVDADIRSFFDAIPHRNMERLLARWLGDRALLALFKLWLEHGAYPTGMFQPRRGISQGAVISPLLCNLYLHQFDDAMQKSRIPFVRFADDFLLFAADRTSAERSRTYAARQLKSLGLEFQTEKTRICKVDSQLRFLGQALVKNKQRKKANDHS